LVILTMFNKLHGKELSYNNLLDVDAAVIWLRIQNDDPTFAILKHNNAWSSYKKTISEAYNVALACDPISIWWCIDCKHKKWCCNSNWNKQIFLK
jgi:AICAR transformylase/IMP cyclohydrolase PurH